MSVFKLIMMIYRTPVIEKLPCLKLNPRTVMLASPISNARLDAVKKARNKPQVVYAET